MREKNSRDNSPKPKLKIHLHWVMRQSLSCTKPDICFPNDALCGIILTCVCIPEKKMADVNQGKEYGRAEGWGSLFGTDIFQTIDI